MADPTPEPIEAAARALRNADCTGRQHGTSACPDRHCRDSRTLPGYRDRARIAITAALGVVGLVQELAEAQHPHLWNGRFEAALRKMPRTFPTEVLVQESLQKKRRDAVQDAELDLARLRTLLGVVPECPVCGSTTPGSTPSCDCDAHRDVPSTEAGEADPGLLLILLGGILGALLLAGVLAFAGVLG